MNAENVEKEVPATAAIQPMTERMAKLAIAMHNAAMAENWKTMADCELRLGELMEQFADVLDTSLTMEELGFDSDTRRIALEADLVAEVALK